MQCPLCRENVADENALQVHYLMSCLGYLESTSTNKPSEGSPVRRKKLVQFRWVKTKPTLAREVYLISSLAGSVKLNWKTIDECFLSDPVEVPEGLHVCQLIVDGDSLTTDDFNVSDTSRTIDVLVSEASLAEGSTGNVSSHDNDSHERQQQSQSSHDTPGNEQDGVPEATTQELPPKGSLYRELLTHQILHGDPLDAMTGTAGTDLRETTRSRRHRTRGNGFAVRNSERDQNSSSKSSAIGQALRGSHGDDVTRTGDDANTRPEEDIPGRHSESASRRSDDVLRHDSMSSEELEQFLQPTRTRQENEADVAQADNEGGTTEERESLPSGNEEFSASLSSHEDLERRPELLGQSNGENNESRVPPTSSHDGVSDHVADLSTSRQEPSDDHRQETLLIDFHEESLDHAQPSNDSRKNSDDHREGMSSNGSRPVALGNDQEKVHRKQSDNDREATSSSRRKHFSVDRERTPNVLEQSSGDAGARHLVDYYVSGRQREQPYGHHREESSGNDGKRTSGDNREMTSNVRRASGDRREETADDNTADDNTSVGLRDVRSDDDRDRTSHNRLETLGDVLETSNDLRTEISGDLQERSSANTRRQDSGESGRETALDSRREGTSGDRGKETKENRGESSRGQKNSADTPVNDENNVHSSDEGTSAVHTTTYVSLPTTLSSGITQESHTEDSSRTTRTRVLRQEHTAGLSVGDLISPQQTTTTTGSLGLEGETKDLIPPWRTASSTGSHVLEDDTKDLISPRSTATSTGIHEVKSGGLFSLRVSATTGSRALGTETRGTTGDDLLFRNHSTSSAALKTHSTYSRAMSAPILGSNFARDDKYPALTRRSPQGSLLDDGVRHPPLYTSAPSRPFTSLPYSPNIAISPLTSPRDGEVGASSASRPGASAERITNESRETPVSTQNMLDRQTPTGSALSPEGVQVTSSGHVTNSKLLSNDQIKELLESLKQQSSRRQNASSPETSPRDRLAASEVITLKAKLAEREEYVKKLKAKNSANQGRIAELSKKEIELTKALSLAEASQKDLKEQEEIASELTNALSVAEKQYAELEVDYHALKREQRSLRQEMEEESKAYEKKIKELKSANASLEEKVKSLREGMRYLKDYQHLLEKYDKSCAVAASLEDQVKILQEENKNLKEKLARSRQDSPTRYARDIHVPRTTGSLGTSREGHVTTSINGYPDHESSVFVGRQQTDTRRNIGDSVRQHSGVGRHQPSDVRDFRSNVRHPYDSHRTLLENNRYLLDSSLDRVRSQSDSIRSHLDSQSQVEGFRSRHDRSRDHSESPRHRSDAYGSESVQTSPRVEDREPKSRRRVATADDAASSGISDFSQFLPKRSYSSDSIRNGLLYDSQGKVSPSHKRGNHESSYLERERSKDKARLKATGSYDNLHSSKYTAATQTNDFILTGHRLDHSPTSAASTSPRSGRRSSPEKGTPFGPKTPQEIDEGMTVLVTRSRGRMSKGQVRYVGYLPGISEKVFLGLALHEADGKHDGKYDGQRFFKCKPNHGVFVTFDKVVMAYM